MLPCGSQIDPRQIERQCLHSGRGFVATAEGHRGYTGSQHFKGLDTHRRAIASGAKRHGATVHFVVAEIDAGPIIAQEAIDVRDDDTEAALAERVLEVEHRLYPRALREVAAGRTKLTASRADNG